MEEQELSVLHQKVLYCFMRGERLSVFEISATLGFSRNYINDTLRIMECKNLVKSISRANKVYWIKTEK